MYNPSEIRNGLQASVGELAESYWLYVRNPKTDFSRTGKLSFRDLIMFELEMGGGTLRSELLDYFNYSADTPTPSAFVEDRKKILPDAFSFLLYDMNERFPLSGPYTFKGLGLKAYDGSYLPIVPDKNDQLTYVEAKDDRKPHALLRLNAMYDVLGERYTDINVQPMRGDSEGKCLIEAIDRYRGPKNIVIILDRFYEIWNVIGHLLEAGLYFLIRAKGPENPGGIVQGLHVPKDGLYDITVPVALSHSKAKAVMELPGYKYINNDTDFDFINKAHPVYQTQLRVVRVELSTGEIETLITNLPAPKCEAQLSSSGKPQSDLNISSTCEPEPASEEQIASTSAAHTTETGLTDGFSPEDLKQIYWYRWPIEEGWSHLKYDEGLLEEHSKTPELILQEIYARFVMFNYDSMILHSLAPLPDDICNSEDSAATQKETPAQTSSDSNAGPTMQSAAESGSPAAANSGSAQSIRDSGALSANRTSRDTSDSSDCSSGAARTAGSCASDQSSPDSDSDPSSGKDTAADDVGSGRRCRKYALRYNFAVGALLSHAFLQGKIDEQTLRHIMRQSALPIRPGFGEHPRRHRRKTSITFRYRMIA